MRGRLLTRALTCQSGLVLSGLPLRLLLNSLSDMLLAVWTALTDTRRDGEVPRWTSQMGACTIRMEIDEAATDDGGYFKHFKKKKNESRRAAHCPLVEPYVGGVRCIYCAPLFQPIGFHTVPLTISNYLPVRAKGNKFPPIPPTAIILRTPTSTDSS